MRSRSSTCSDLSIALRFATIRGAYKSMIRNALERLRISPQNAADRSPNRVLPRP